MVKKIIGVVVVLFAVYTFISIISYVSYSWKYDAVVSGEVANLGKLLGHKISVFFVNGFFGISSVFLIPILFFIGIKLVFNRYFFNPIFVFLNLVFITILLSILMGYFFPSDLVKGGKFGIQIASKLKEKIGVGLPILNIVLLLFYFLVFYRQVKKMFSREKRQKLDSPLPEVKTKVKHNKTDVVSQKDSSASKKKLLDEQEDFFDPKKSLSNFTFPQTNLLVNYEIKNSKTSQEELEKNKEKIVQTLGHYGIFIDKIKATVGPSVTLYEIIPKAGIKISRIKSLEDDIALSLAALGIRIIAPIPGKGTIGIEIPNQKGSIVSAKTLIDSKEFQNSTFEIPICLGKNISNENIIIDLTKQPHLLLAGATGQGKSVCLNIILTSIIYKKHPSEVKFVLIDPKKVELTLFSSISELFLAKIPNNEGEPIITDTQKVVETLNSLCIEMDNRYTLLRKAKTRNIKEYNSKFSRRKLNPNNGHQFLPFMIIVIDEFADLIMTAGKEVELPLTRLAQLARAIGIHLIIATQRPSVNIITGLIKANFPSRIAFRVTSKIDSRTILDSGGADQLIGRGDMLFSSNGSIQRIQCPLIETDEVERYTEFIQNQNLFLEPYFLPEYVAENSQSDNVEFSSEENLLFQAGKIIVLSQSGSTSLVQRRLKLGYNKAARLVEELENKGIVGPPKGNKPREVFVTTELELAEKLA